MKSKDMTPLLFRSFKLSDGTSVTVAEVKEAVGVTKESAHRRLKLSNDRDTVFRTDGAYRSYTLDDGTIVTVGQLVIDTGLPSRLLYHRLRIGTRDMKSLIKAPNKNHKGRIPNKKAKSSVDTPIIVGGIRLNKIARVSTVARAKWEKSVT